MACSVSVPLLLLLLPLLASAVANVYEQSAGVYNARPWYARPSTASECVSSCDADPLLSGYVYENGQCTTYWQDCRGPAAAGDPAPANYMVKNACPGTDLDPCACPEGFHRYGARCLKLIEQLVGGYDAYYHCRGLNAHAAVPRTLEENDMMKLAVAELQTEPLTKIRLGVYHQYSQAWQEVDGCGIVTKHFWAAGQPHKSGNDVVYSPPGVTESPNGWHNVDGNNAFKLLCQLLHCYRPDCLA